MLRVHQQPASRGWGMGHGHLQFWVIVPTRIFKGLREIMVENIFALAVRFAIEWRHADGVITEFGLEVMRCPAGTRPHRLTIFQSFQKAVCGERVNWRPAQGLWAGAAVPLGLRYLRQAGEHIDLNLRLLAHGALNLLPKLKMRHVSERSRQISLKSDIVRDAARAALFIW